MRDFLERLSLSRIEDSSLGEQLKANYATIHIITAQTAENHDVNQCCQKPVAMHRILEKSASHHQIA